MLNCTRWTSAGASIWEMGITTLTHWSFRTMFSGTLVLRFAPEW